MLDQVKKVLQDREHASRLLSEKLSSYKNSNAVIVALLPGGAGVANNLSSSLRLPLEILVAAQIKHPAHSDRSIGAVTANDVFLQDGTSAIPQHYIYHQIHQLQHRIKDETDAYHRKLPEQILKDRVVIVCDTFISETDRLTACLQSLKAQGPSRIIVATLLATSKVAFVMTDHELEFHYVTMILHRDVNSVIEMCENNHDEISSPTSLPTMTSIF